MDMFIDTKRPGVNFRRILLWGILLLYLLTILLSVVWLFLTSLKTDKDIYRLPVIWLPKEKVDIQNYVEAFFRRNFTRFTLNSFLITGGVFLICLTFGSLAAYGLARFRFPGKNMLLFLIIGARFVAPVALVLPFFLIAYNLRLLNTHWALILADSYMNLPFFILILSRSMEQIPRDVTDSAKIDGCSEIDVFFRIVLPLSKAGLAAGAVFTFVFTWNEFLFASTLTSTDFAKPLTVGITEFIGDRTIEWGPLSAGGIFSMIPTLVFILFLQRHIIKGVMAGAVKG